MSSPDRPIFTAADLLAHKRARGLLPESAPPETVIIVLQRTLLDYVRRRYSVIRLRGFNGEMFGLKKMSGRVAVCGNLGLGSPVVAATADELAAWGVKRFLLIGLAGGLQSDLQAGDLVLANRAWRGEGTSGHYLSPSQWAEAAPHCVADWAAALGRRGKAVRVGDSWTTDAPFREMLSLVIEKQTQGVLTVEMEAAALLAVAQATGAQAAAAFVVADTLAEGRWRLTPNEDRLAVGLRILFEAALETVT
jgi:uridine phosphorylase